MINYEMLEASRKKLVSLKELMEILKMSKMSIYRLFEKRELIPTTKFNGKIYISGDDVYKFVIKKNLLTDDTKKDQALTDDKEEIKKVANTGAIRLRIKN